MNEESQEKQDIIFGSQDLEKDVVANNNAVVISATVANFWVKKVLVDNGSSLDIIFYKAFSQMGVNNADLSRINTPIISFTGSIAEPMGEDEAEPSKMRIRRTWREIPGIHDVAKVNRSQSRKDQGNPGNATSQNHSGEPKVDGKIGSIKPLYLALIR
ncbi:UNVERIFIED_CONTAM: hypothetical protein Scaly_2982100 [Sesamum calycinum]|uniref:Uncharacterized protein n=1 Tax=Sesamum calycinum TaxID=2727403 RepID=A0AAW2KNC6_9LAMI